MNINAFKQTLVAIVAAATLGATGLASTQASANDYGYGYGSYGGYGYIAIPRTATATAIPLTATVTATGTTATAPGNRRFPGFPSTRRDFHHAASSSRPPTGSLSSPCS
jgi:hypothetical protein